MIITTLTIHCTMYIPLCFSTRSSEKRGKKLQVYVRRSGCEQFCVGQFAVVYYKCIRAGYHVPKWHPINFNKKLDRQLHTQQSVACWPSAGTQNARMAWQYWYRHWYNSQNIFFTQNRTISYSRKWKSRRFQQQEFGFLFETRRKPRLKAIQKPTSPSFANIRYNYTQCL